LKPGRPADGCRRRCCRTRYQCSRSPLFENLGKRRGAIAGHSAVKPIGAGDAGAKQGDFGTTVRIACTASTGYRIWPWRTAPVVVALIGERAYDGADWTSGSSESPSRRWPVTC
jgi:hypothetical protein